MNQRGWLSWLPWFLTTKQKDDTRPVQDSKPPIFDLRALEGVSYSAGKAIYCAAPFNNGTQLVFATADGVHVVSLVKNRKGYRQTRSYKQLLALLNVKQVAVLEANSVLLVLSDQRLHAFSRLWSGTSSSLEVSETSRVIATGVAYFKLSPSPGQNLICVVRTGHGSSTIKLLEPMLSQGTRVLKEFKMTGEASSVHFLKTKLCVGFKGGFEVLDIDSLDSQLLVNDTDPSLRDLLHWKGEARPLAIYRIDSVYLLCYSAFAFYIHKDGKRARPNWLVRWEGNPTDFALDYPYLIAFEKNQLEVRHVISGALVQQTMATGLRLLHAGCPPSRPANEERDANGQIIVATDSGIMYLCRSGGI